MSFYFKLGEGTLLCVLFVTKCLKNTVHVFCECDKVRPIWTTLQDVINDKLHPNYDLTILVACLGFLVTHFCLPYFYVVNFSYINVKGIE